MVGLYGVPTGSSSGRNDWGMGNRVQRMKERGFFDYTFRILTLIFQNKIINILGKKALNGIPTVDRIL